MRVHDCLRFTPSFRWAVFDGKSAGSLITVSSLDLAPQRYCYLKICLSPKLHGAGAGRA